MTVAYTDTPGRDPRTREMATRRADVADWIALSLSADSGTRRRAVHSLCPCEVKANIPQVWRRLLELARDSDADVRRMVVHALCDGSPAVYRHEVLSTLELLAQDPNERVRRRARHALASYRRTGTVNVF
jgi:HEAT repeat protein